MKIYDISQEVFGCEVYPGDPKPRRKRLCDMGEGDLYNLTAFEMCAHNGTHIDAPYHFLADGKTAEALALEKMIGYAFVVPAEGELNAEGAAGILAAANAVHPEAARRILIKGDAVITLEAADVFAEAGIDLIGTESQSVGPADAPMAVHKRLLSAQVILLEGIRLGEVPCGVHFLNAAPLSLAKADGAPCRAVLMDF